MMIAGKQPCSPSSVAELLDRRTSQVSSAVCQAFDDFLLPSWPEGLALLAAGGFGRRQLFPHSDVDLLLLVERQTLAERSRSAVSGFLQHLWDLGLRVSHSVHTPAACCELHDGNLELSISLLDQRFLAGDRGLYARFSLLLPRFFHGQRQTLARGLCRLARTRHAGAGGSIYQLEPDIKENPGGLRDYQLVGWLGQLHGADPDRLPRAGPPPELHPARDFLFALRHELHLHAGRDSNLLTFDLQEQIAERCGLDPAGWMRRYFTHAREIHRAALREIEAEEEQSSSLLVQFRDWRSRVSNADFSVSRERVYFRAPHRLEHEPPLALGLFQFVARHGLRLAAETERRLGEHLPRLRQFFSTPQPVLWPALKEIFAAPHAALALGEMQQAGFLAALFPEWEGIDCLVIRDFYHRYTVDAHTLVTLQALEDLRASSDPARRAFAEMLSEADEPEVLVFSLLFHDTGKASAAGSHVLESVRLAETAMQRIQVPADQRRIVRLLIDRHLDLSAAIASRDLDDPATARFLAGRAGTLELLKKLTLLTYADVSAVNPTAMSPWRLEQLWRAYLAAYNELTRELDQARLPHSPERAAFLEGLPVRYLRTHSETDIQAHLELEQRSRERGVALDIRRENGFYRLTLVARDRPFLLASLAGALAGFGMNILKAEGFANRQGVILDTFVFADPHRTLELNPSETDRLRVMLERVTLGRIDVRSLLQNRPKPVPPSHRARIRPNVSFNDALSDSATLIQIVAQDRPGLLYDLASAISAAGANIELVLIDTQAHKALDVFYVTAGGGKLSPALQAALRETLDAACKA